MDLTSPSSHAEYQYEPLPPGDYFRYLILQPGVGQEPLKCSLHDALLPQAPYFEAISYVWGTPEKDRDIICDNRVLKITENLEAVLRRVRLPNSHRTLWADSICIDQDVLKEKGHQVALMSSIYKKANRVLIHIGSEDDGHSANLASLVNEVNKMILDTYKTIDMSVWDSFPILRPDDPLLSDARWESLNIFLNQAWFERGWVVQEAGFARDGVVIWGNKELRWNTLWRVLTWASNRAERALMSWEMVVPTLHWTLFRAGHQFEDRVFWDRQRPATNILTLLSYAKDLNFTNQHDRIFAFQDFSSTSSQGRRFRMAPNYEQSYFETFRKFAVDHVRETQSVHILNYVIHDEDTLANKQLPSWIPRWDICFLDSGFELVEESMAPLTCSNDQLYPPKVIGGTQLQVRATIFDSVRFISDVFSNQVELEEMTDVIVDFWNTTSDPTYVSPYPSSDRLRILVQMLMSGYLLGEVDTWPFHRAAFVATFLDKIENIDDKDRQDWKNAAVHGHVDVFHKPARYYTHGRRLIMTTYGYFGLAPAATDEDDLCSIIFGCQIPSTLRQVERQPHTYKLIGSMYMKGQHSIAGEDGPESYQDQEFGTPKSKEWTEWGVGERDILLS
jgi:hypothetical protein